MTIQPQGGGMTDGIKRDPDEVRRRLGEVGRIVEGDDE